MGTLSVSVPDDLRERMAKLEFLKKLASKSKLTEKDTMELRRKINDVMMVWLRSLGAGNFLIKENFNGQSIKIILQT